MREAFASEVQARLPRLEALVEGLTDPDDRDDARRDAHTLASSAYLVDRPDIGVLARAVEHDLDHGPLAELLPLLRAFLDERSA